MANQINNDYFINATVSTANFADCHLTWPFNSAGMIIFNEGSATIQYSFDGTNIAGDINPAYMSGLSFDNRFECQIYFRLVSAGAPVTVRFEAWAIP